MYFLAVDDLVVIEHLLDFVREEFTRAEGNVLPVPARDERGHGAREVKVAWPRGLSEQVGELEEHRRRQDERGEKERGAQKRAIHAFLHSRKGLPQLPVRHSSSNSSTQRRQVRRPETSIAFDLIFSWRAPNHRGTLVKCTRDGLSVGIRGKPKARVRMQEIGQSVHREAGHGHADA